MTYRDYNLDVLKAIAIVFVLIWHLQPIRIELDSSALAAAGISKYLLEVLYSRTLVAVPILYFVSLFLFFKKIKGSTEYLSRRIKRLVNIFVFWFTVQSGVYLITRQVAFSLELPFENSPHNAKFLWILFMGGPSLPKVGDSVFYFILNLLILTVFSCYYGKIATRRINGIFFVILSGYLFIHQFYYAIPYLRIDNFIIYIPIAHFMSNNLPENFVFQKKHLLYTVVIYILFSIYEIVSPMLFSAKYSTYDINSLQWGVISLYIFVNIYSVREYKVVKWISKYSLGLFAMHKFWLLIILYVFCLFPQINVFTASVAGIYIQWEYILYALVTVFFTVLAIKCFSFFDVLRKYVV